MAMEATPAEQKPRRSQRPSTEGLRLSLFPNASRTSTPRTPSFVSPGTAPSPGIFGSVSPRGLPRRLLTVEAAARAGYRQLASPRSPLITPSKLTPPPFRPPPPPSPSPQVFRHARASLGLLGLLVIVGGTVLSLGTLALLVFLWVGEGLLPSSVDSQALAVWRWIVLGGRLTQVITLASAVLRITVASQTVLGTSMLAAILLEKHGVPFSQAAELSITRAANDGPLRLVWLMLSTPSSRRRARLPLALALALLAAGLASQFTSTILVSDLAGSVLTGEMQIAPVADDLDPAVVDTLPLAPTNGLAMFTPFGELVRPAGAGAGAAPTDGEVDDTGFVQRVFLPLPETNRSHLRSYVGKAYVYSSRFVCARPPGVNATLQLLPTGTRQPDLEQAHEQFIPVLAGNISSGSPCTVWDDGCLPPSASSFNCSLPFITAGSGTPASATAMSACAAPLTNIPDWAVSGDPMSNVSRAYLFFVTSNLTAYEVNRALLAEGPISPTADPISQGEFLLWQLHGNISVAMSVCFQQAAFHLADVSVSSDRDLPAPMAHWNSTTREWDVGALSRMFGRLESNMSASARGIYAVGAASNLTRTDLTRRLTRSLLLVDSSTEVESTDDNRGPNWLLSPGASGHCPSASSPDARSRSLFVDTLQRAGGQPARAFLDLMTTVAGMQLANAILQMSISHGSSAISASATALAAQGHAGLAVVAVIVVTALACVAATTGLFLAHTKYSRVAYNGGCWQAVAHVVSEESRWIVDASAEMSDDGVSELVEARVGNETVRLGKPSGEKRGRVEIGARRRRKG